MCGRYTLAKPIKTIAEHFSAESAGVEHRERYNVAPTQIVPVVTAREDLRRLLPMRWGLIPSWAKDASMGAKLINARAETVDQKPSFKASFKNKRCLIPSDGFIEWEKTSHGKVPHYFFLKDSPLFAFAGIWAEWKDKNGIAVLTYSILTTEANAFVGAFHSRMPVILAPHNYPLWLNRETSQESLKTLLSPFPAEKMDQREISKMINSPTNDRRECLEKINGT